MLCACIQDMNDETECKHAVKAAVPCVCVCRVCVCVCVCHGVCVCAHVPPVTVSNSYAYRLSLCVFNSEVYHVTFNLYSHVIIPWLDVQGQHLQHHQQHEL